MTALGLARLSYFLSSLYDYEWIPPSFAYGHENTQCHVIGTRAQSANRWDTGKVRNPNVQENCQKARTGKGRSLKKLKINSLLCVFFFFVLTTTYFLQSCQRTWEKFFYLQIHLDFLKKERRMGIFTRPVREILNPRPRSAAFPDGLKEAQVWTHSRPAGLIRMALADPPSLLKPCSQTDYESVGCRTRGTSPWGPFQGTRGSRERAWGSVPGAWLGSWAISRTKLYLCLLVHKKCLHCRNK